MRAILYIGLYTKYEIRGYGGGIIWSGDTIDTARSWAHANSIRVTNMPKVLVDPTLNHDTHDKI